MLSAQLLGEALDSAPDAIVIVDLSGCILFVNSRVKTLLGYDPGELVGRNIECLVPERLRTQHVTHRRHYGARPSARSMGAGLELYARRKDASELPVEISLSPIHGSGQGGLIAAALRDATERKQTQAQLVAARDVADRANQAKSRFLATASHDLRQPLQTLALLGGALRRLVADPTAREALTHQEQAIESMAKLLNALLDISKLESGAIEAHPADFAVAALFEEMRREFADLAASKGLELRITATGDHAYSDRALVGQVLRNLMSNALKYTAQGSVTLRSVAGPAAVRIEVADTGIGIAADQLTHIYDEFYQVGVVPGANRDGYGLGLSIVRRVVDLLQLRIEAQSAPGRGSTFALELPRGKIAAAEGQRSTPAATVRGVGADAPCVLLVDDDASVLKATRLLLQVEGYRVIPAASLAEAMQQARDNPRLNLVVTDYHLGKSETGTQLIAAVREIAGRKVKAVLLTGDTSARIRDQRPDDGVHLVSKPIDPDQLLALMKSLL